MSKVVPSKNLGIAFYSSLGLMANLFCADTRILFSLKHIISDDDFSHSNYK